MDIKNFVPVAEKIGKTACEVGHLVTGYNEEANDIAVATAKLLGDIDAETLSSSAKDLIISLLKEEYALYESSSEMINFGGDENSNSKLDAFLYEITKITLFLDTITDGKNKETLISVIEGVYGVIANTKDILYENA